MALLVFCKVLQGNMSEGIRIIEQAIHKQENEGYRGAADWYRLAFCEVYLQMIAGSEKPPLPVLLKNLPILLTVIVTASTRIRALVAHAMKNPQFDPNGHFVGWANMILGLLYKTKKKHILATGHLTEARRVWTIPNAGACRQRARRNSPRIARLSFRRAIKHEGSLKLI
jgi:hypothetical protein